MNDNDGKETWLEISNLRKKYGDFVAVDGINLNIKKGEFLTLLGSSGSGKSTTLLAVAGFLEPSEGKIMHLGESILDKPPHKRNMGMVFQQYSLFPHMTIFDNVAFPLKMRKVKKAEIKERVTDILASVELEEYADRMPNQLSGGQQQRVALARALVFEPSILLMDEPLAALDKKLRDTLQMEIRQLHERLGLTIIYVTHDQEEALKMSDRVAVFAEGNIIQIGKPQDLYDRPKSQYVAQFLGDSNVFHGTVQEKNNGYVSVMQKDGNTLRATTDQTFESEDAVVVMVRPEKVTMGKAKETEFVHNVVEAKIDESVYLGESYQYLLTASSGEPIVVKQQISLIDEQKFEVGDHVYISWDSENSVVLPSNGDSA